MLTIVWGSFFFAHGAGAAEGCVKEPIDEEGGVHRCFETPKGHVHVWRPTVYNPATAVTVVYMHGYNIDESSRNQDHYIDRAWTKHRLAAQFAASGINAIFIAPEGPLGNSSDVQAKYTSVKWGSLSDLLSAARTGMGEAIPANVAAMGHSAGIYTISSWLDDPSLKHVITLDAMYPSGDDTRVNQLFGWYGADLSRKLTLAGGSATNGRTGVLAKKIAETVTVQGVPPRFDDAQLAARSLWLDSTTPHMAVVTGGAVIPLVLKRVGPPAGAGLIATTDPTALVAPIAPRLEIPIPNITFSGVGFNFISEYVAGLYKFLLGIAGVLTATMMIVGGFQYLTAGGDRTRIEAGKKRIGNAMVGFILAFGSYALLYTINPGLTEFRALNVTTVRGQILGLEDTSEVGLFQAGSSSTSGEAPSHGAKAVCRDHPSCKSFCKVGNCVGKGDSNKCQNPDALPGSTPGMMDPKDARPIEDVPGLKGNGNTSSQTVVDLLKKAAEVARAKDSSYVINVTSGYRVLRRQIELACGAYEAGSDGKVGSTIAWPGGSFHGVGYAVDLQLWKGAPSGRCTKDKLDCLSMSGDSTAQNDPHWEKGAKILESIMLEAGFRRLENEIWHFEPKSAPAVGCRCTSNCPFPARCVH